MPREEMARDLYLVDTLVSTKRRSSLNNVQENFKEVYQEATEAIESENFERSTVRILYKFYEMYYYNDVQDDLNAVVAGALGKSAGKTMEEASEILYEALEKIMEDDLSADDRDFDAGELGIAGATAAEPGAADGRRHAGPCRADAGRDAGGTGQRRHGRIHAAGAGIPAKNDGTGPRATKITALNPYILWNRTIFTRRYSK